jgi:hypothetical protein
MVTIEEAIAWQNRRGIALVEAFGLDASRVPQNDGVELRHDGGVTFNTLDGQRDFPGKKLTKKQAAALREYRFPAPEPKREPTWLDVFRAMHRAGYSLKIEEREGDYRKFVVPVGTDGEVASIIRETLGGKPCWSVDICGYLMYSVRLHNPPPADVLAAARLVKLLADTDQVP